MTPQYAKEIIRDARDHVAADAACGRAWECSCGACRIVRNDPVLLNRLTVSTYLGGIGGKGGSSKSAKKSASSRKNAAKARAARKSKKVT